MVDDIGAYAEPPAAEGADITGYWIVWRARVQPGDADALGRLDRSLAFLRHQPYVAGADYDLDPAGRTVVFGISVEYTATRGVAVHRASRALRDGLQRAGIGVPHGLPYTPAPAMRLVLDSWPRSVKRIRVNSPLRPGQPPFSDRPFHDLPASQHGRRPAMTSTTMPAIVARSESDAAIRARRGSAG